MSHELTGNIMILINLLNNPYKTATTAKIPSPWVRKPRAEEAYHLLLLPHYYEDEPPVG